MFTENSSSQQATASDLKKKIEDLKKETEAKDKEVEKLKKQVENVNKLEQDKNKLLKEARLLNYTKTADKHIQYINCFTIFRLEIKQKR